ncbi:MAG TPA: ribonuclease HII [Staphylococcus sp.]|uniref:Ribonuclease HII n=1 Tax=Mammaliicoccus vitulinus TaxID=71237 RepID=A0ABX7HEH8_9STAP|nr:ribonuclease HII [Mammaliicoccus vitulinus]PNZ37725.1 ribonuclease HII [Mammaliicoccus vitulinus]QRO85019.1 ribonuclease HII [Mammaliicoccus vitulinus]QTN12271.1 ribonuclease HII [Mammaliicoccus vitulinus]HAL08850.1 ribonuclease HII [Staphylococcus sp.]
MKQKSIKEITSEIQQYATIDAINGSIHNEDERKGVQNALIKRIKQLEKIEELNLKYEKMNQYENRILSENQDALICGIDEVGRGPLAGPVVASAVILERGHHYLGITDSKALSQSKRSFFEQEIYNKALSVGIGIATVEEIDELNIYEATKVAMQRAIDQLNYKPDHLLIDAMTLANDIPQTSIIKGDLNSVSIAAASVIAKEYRDKLMTEFNLEYPGYDFDKNKGYGTKTHLEGIETCGITPIHRKSFEPIKSKVKY